MFRAKRMKSIEEVLAEVEALIDAHFYNKFSETKTSRFLKNIATHGSIEMKLFIKTWRTPSCTKKRIKVIRGTRENLL